MHVISYDKRAMPLEFPSLKEVFWVLLVVVVFLHIKHF